MINDFITYLGSVRGYSMNTIESYNKDLTQFVTWAKGYNLRWSTIKQTDVELYIQFLDERGMSAATKNRHLSAISGIYKYFIAHGMLKNNPAKYIPRCKQGEHLPNTIPPQDIKEAIKHADAQTALALQLFYATGIRISELLALDTRDLDLQKMTIKITGKGDKQRIVYFDENTRDMIVNHLQGWQGKIFNGIEQRQMRYMVWDALRPYTTAKQLSPHAIRHTFATELTRNGMPTSSVASLLGHNTIETTEKYIKLADVGLQNQYNKYMRA